MRYLYPCRCGRKHSIQTHQAGQTLHCECGAEIEAPTLRKIVLLEKDTSVSTASKKSSIWNVAWGVRQRLLLLGAVLLAVSCISAGIAWASWPTPPTGHVDGDAIYQEVMAFTPLQSMHAWKTLLYTPLDSPAMRRVSPVAIVLYQQKLAEQRSLFLMSAIAAVLALAFLVGAIMTGGKWENR